MDVRARRQPCPTPGCAARSSARPAQELAGAVGRVGHQPLRRQPEPRPRALHRAAHLVEGARGRSLHVDGDRVRGVDRVVQAVGELHALVGLGRTPDSPDARVSNKGPDRVARAGCTPQRQCTAGLRVWMSLSGPGFLRGYRALTLGRQGGSGGARARRSGDALPRSASPRAAADSAPASLIRRPPRRAGAGGR